MALITVTEPAAEPVTASEIKASARIDGAEFDGQIALLIAAFRQQAEHSLGRRLITQTVDLVIDEFPSDSDIDLLLPCVQSVESVKYYDADGVQQTIDPAAYSLDSDSTPCWLLVIDDWPTTKDAANAVHVRYTVGYGDAPTDVPTNIRLWIIAHVCQALDNPSGLDTENLKTLPYLDRLLDAERVWRVA
jgi:uncharacterized phiE125 gp8 family phage protein